jgi:hypothetical protein
MIIESPELIFAKVKVPRIMIENILNQVLNNTTDAEGWLEALNKLDNNGIGGRCYGLLNPVLGSPHV